jgi:DNA-binding transcriptional MerR regulator
MDIRDASAASGLSSDTIRFYEKRGVLPPPPRRANRYRTYTDDHVRRLRLVRGLRELGLSLDAIGRIAGVAHDGTCGDLRLDLMESLTTTCAEVEIRIEELRRTRGELDSLVRGLRRMTPRSDDVPGLSACDCASLVTATPNP